MSWFLDLDRIASRLIPKKLRNNRMFQWVRSTVSPLEDVNADFMLFAEQKLVEAAMSSQTMLLEGYLNDLYSSEFADPTTEFIEIIHSYEQADATYFTDETPSGGHMVVYNGSESPTSPSIFFDAEDSGMLPEDFGVVVPISLQGNESVIRGIMGIVDKYKIDTKTYSITYSV